jgi:hypothetical protein
MSDIEDAPKGFSAPSDPEWVWRKPPSSMYSFIWEPVTSIAGQQELGYLQNLYFAFMPYLWRPRYPGISERLDHTHPNRNPAYDYSRPDAWHDLRVSPKPEAVASEIQK